MSDLTNVGTVDWLGSSVRRHPVNDRDANWFNSSIRRKLVNQGIETSEQSEIGTRQSEVEAGEDALLLVVVVNCVRPSSRGAMKATFLVAAAYIARR